MPTGTEPPPGPWAKAVADAITDLLTSAQLTRATVAERIGMHPSTLGRCLNGYRSLTLDELARVAAALGLTPTAIVLRAQRLLTGNLDVDPEDVIVSPKTLS